MKGFLKIVGCCLLGLATLQSQAMVVNVIEFEGDVTAGDTGVGSASYTESSTPPAPINAAEGAFAADNEGSILGVAGAAGFASADDNQLGFSQQSLGVGQHSSSATTLLTQSITNTNAVSGVGTLTSQILAGGLFLQTADSNSLSDFNGLASFSFGIALDGVDLFAFSGSIAAGGIIESNTGFLNGLQMETRDDQVSLSWEATSLELDLGTFDAGQTRELEITLNTQTSDTVGCAVLDINSCVAVSASLGDPPTDGFGYVTLFSIIGDPDMVDVPEPSSIGLLVMSAIGLVAARRRKILTTAR